MLLTIINNVTSMRKTLFNPVLVQAQNFLSCRCFFTRHVIAIEVLERQLQIVLKIFHIKGTN